jgi:hypothetical protein
LAENTRERSLTGSQWKAALELRAKRVRQLHIRPLDRSERKHFLDNWRDLERRFIDDPNGILVQADRLISRVMSAKDIPCSISNSKPPTFPLITPPLSRAIQVGNEHV